MPTQHASSEDRVEASLRVPVLQATGANGVAGRSVVVYAGLESDAGAAERAQRRHRLRRVRARDAARILTPAQALIPDDPGHDIHGLLADRKILITGVLSNRSIAYGVAKACHREGATLAFTYASDELKDRVAKLAARIRRRARCCPATSRPTTRSRSCSMRCAPNGTGSTACCTRSRSRRAKRWPAIFSTALSRAAFATAHDVSSYSFAALAKAARPLLAGRNASLLTLTYLGAVRALANYNVMGLAKASLEANVRYLAAALGPEGTRVNAISRGPDQDARGGGHRRLLEDPALRRADGAAAPQRDDRRSRQRRRVLLLGRCRARSPARSPTSIAASRTSPRDSAE